MNFDVGEMTIPTRSHDNRVWWALGSPGLQMLQDGMGRVEGVRHFGFRLGAFVRTLCSVFRPRTVVFSGGIIESWWDELSPGMRKEFYTSCPDWLDAPKLVRSLHGRNAALWGMMRFVNRMARDS